MTFAADATMDPPNIVRPRRASSNAKYSSEPTKNVEHVPPFGGDANRVKYPPRVRRHFAMSLILLLASLVVGLVSMITGASSLIYVSQGMFFGGGIMFSISLLSASRSVRQPSPTSSNYNGWVSRQTN